MDIVTAVVVSGAVLAAWDGVRRVTASNKRFDALEVKLTQRETERDHTVANHGVRLLTLEQQMTVAKNIAETAKAQSASRWAGK